MLNTGHQIKILIVDDDEDDYFIIKEYVEAIEANKFIIDWCNDYALALEKICSKNYDIYFVDYRLGNETGLELLQEAINAGCEQPVIVLTGKGNKSIDIESMRIGATDYLVKPDLNTEKLERSIRYALERSTNLKSLRKNEKKYKNLFERSKDSVFIADIDLVFKEVNPAACSLSGLNMQDLLGKSLYDFIGDHKQVSLLKNKLDHFEDVHDIDIEFLTSEHELKYCLLSLTIESNEDQQFVHGIIHDITDLKQAEKITLQIEKFEANERLISVIAHEIRNPLTNISLAIDQLKLMNVSDEEEQFIQIIKRNTARINQLIKELLDFAKSVELNVEKISIQEILDSTLINSADRLQLQAIHVTKDCPAYPLFVMADKSKLSIALSNIIINAIEAMEKEGKLFIKTEESENYFSLFIKDNGKGIPPEYLTRISEPFFTLKRNGIGIGLASTFTILRSHKASVHVESSVGVGTSFIISFEKVKATSLPEKIGSNDSLNIH